MEDFVIRWTDYMIYRIRLLGFDIAIVENIVRYSSERYFDAESGRSIAVGRHQQDLVIIPYERDEQTLTPVTIHLSSRPQIDFRVKTGRFKNE